MRLAELARRAMSMDERTWERHANPWSFWTRFATGSPLITVVAWLRVDLAWWTLLPAVGLAFWLWYNPRAFPPPAHTHHWESRAVFGERIWLEDRSDLPAEHRRAGRILIWLAGAATLVWLYGMVMLHLWATVVGLVVSMMAKTWFVDRMAWLFDVMRDVEPRYDEWMRSG